jgi:hypothetical protein
MYTQSFAVIHRCDSPANLIHVFYHCDSTRLVSTSPVFTRKPLPSRERVAEGRVRAFMRQPRGRKVPKMGLFSRARNLATAYQDAGYRFSTLRKRADFSPENGVFRASQQTSHTEAGDQTTKMSKINQRAADSAQRQAAEMAGCQVAERMGASVMPQLYTYVDRRQLALQFPSPNATLFIS